MSDDPDDEDFERIGVDKIMIERLRKSDKHDRREYMDYEIRRLMTQSYGR